MYACSDWNGSACVGNEFFYEYDGAGNLLRFDRWNESASQVETVRYVYNGASQIQCIDADSNNACDNGEIVWLYDAFGNLISDGTATYTYDAAMRLVSVTNAAGTTTYSYNGDGDRVAQTVNGVQTTYTIDAATPLTMVLAEITNGQILRYLHGLDLVAQSDGTTTEYFEYDGLGSVRQLTDPTGSVLLAQTLDPYGNGYVLAGSAETNFGYTGEQVDSNGFVYLRARYYNPAHGRFFQIDPSRQEQSPYQYSMSNPVTFSDPSGLLTEEEATGDLPEPQLNAEEIREILNSTYNIIVPQDYGYYFVPLWSDMGGYFIDERIDKWWLGVCSGEWEPGAWRSLEELQIVLESAEQIALKFGSPERMRAEMGRVTIFRASLNSHGEPFPASYAPGQIDLPDAHFNGSSDVDQIYWTLHEFGHVWNWQKLGTELGIFSWPMRQRLEESGYTYTRCLRGSCTSIVEPFYLTAYVANPSVGSPLSYISEDWAEAFASYVTGVTSDDVPFTPLRYPIRFRYVQEQFR